MATQKPLAKLLPEIIDHYNRYVEYLEMNRRLYEIFEGQLLEEVKKSLQKEIISPAAFARACERIPSINIMRKSVDKLSKVYIENPVRHADNEQDAEMMQNIVRSSNFNNCMTTCNMYLNMHRMFAVEPFVNKGEQQFRVLGGHQFLPYSDDPSDPGNMTVFIKLLGNELVKTAPRFDEDGKKTTTEEEIRTVTVLALYSDDEFLIVDTGGAIRKDKMRELGINISNESDTSQNPFGRIPFFYGNKSRTELIPFPNQEGLNMSILIPKLYTDLNYAAQFMSHSIIWAKNTDLTGQELNPDAVVNLGERTEENGDPEIGVITPSVDIPNVIAMINSELQMYLSSIGIRTNSMGSISPGQEASGVAKAIDEGDTTGERKVQVEFFRNAEMNLWDLVKDMQNVWVDAGIVSQERRKFSPSFEETFSIIFAEMKPLKTMRQKIEEIQLLRDQRLISRKMSIKQLFPELSDKQVDQWLEDLDKEAEEAFDNMMGNPQLIAERSAEGTFNEGNQAGANQDPAKNLESREEN